MSSQLQTSLVLQLMITPHWTHSHNETSLSTTSYSLINVATLVNKLTTMKMLLLLLLPGKLTRSDHLVKNCTKISSAVHENCLVFERMVV